MSRLPTTILPAVLFLLLPLAAAAQDDPVEAAYERAEAAYEAAETPAEQVAIGQGFLADHPESRHTVRVLREITRLMADELDDHAGATAYAREFAEGLSDEELAFEAWNVLAGLYARPGFAAELEATLDRAYAGREPTYVECLGMMEAAAGAEAWDLILAKYEAAAPQATAEAFAAAYPDRGFSEEYIAEAGRNRTGLIDTFRGWALANLGRTADARAAFTAAEAAVRKNYLGRPGNDLDYYRGRALLMDDQPAEAFPMLALAAMFGGNDEAWEPAREAYDRTHHGGDAGFEKALWDLRLQHARTVDGFTLADYEGRARSFDDLKGEVTLLAFWFPT
jgi:hypothetical protein